MKPVLFYISLFICTLGYSQSINIVTSVTNPDQPPATIDDFWYWSWGVQVYGTGFTPNADIIAYAVDPNGDQWRDYVTTTDGNGNFVMNVTAKKNESVFGLHTMYVSESNNNNSTSATFTVINSPYEIYDLNLSTQELTLSQFFDQGFLLTGTGLETFEYDPNDPDKAIVTFFSPNEAGSESNNFLPDGKNVFRKTLSGHTLTANWGDDMPHVPGIWRITLTKVNHFGTISLRVLPDNPSTNSYCTIEQVIPSYGGVAVQPITGFEIIDDNGMSIISNNSSVNSVDYYEDFTSIAGIDLEKEKTYTIKLKGKNPPDPYDPNAWKADTYTVFVDWNQNGVLDDDNEIYHEAYLFGSTGEDGQFSSFQLTIPDTAVVGNTRVRILKIDSYSPANLFWPVGYCGYYQRNGQVEDYTINITPSTLGVTDFENGNNLSIYPNPFNDIISIKNSTIVKDIKIHNVLGQQVYHLNVEANEFSLDLSPLATGVYILNAKDKDGKISTAKIIKE